MLFHRLDEHHDAATLAKKLQLTRLDGQDFQHDVTARVMVCTYNLPAIIYHLIQKTSVKDSSPKDVSFRRKCSLFLSISLHAAAKSTALDEENITPTKNLFFSSFFSAVHDDAKF